MTPESAAQTAQQARDSLAEYAAIRAALPDRMLIAVRLGISKTDIADLAGVSRDTVYRLLAIAEGRAFARQLRDELTSAASKVEPRPGLGKIRGKIRGQEKGEGE